MSTKSITQVLTFTLFSLFCIPNMTNAMTIDSTQKQNNIVLATERSNILISRLNEIKNLDKSALTRVEKKELRIELRSIKKEMKSSSNGVYLSVGAIIIIILLLIILL